MFDLIAILPRTQTTSPSKSKEPSQGRQAPRGDGDGSWGESPAGSPTTHAKSLASSSDSLRSLASTDRDAAESPGGGGGGDAGGRFRAWALRPHDQLLLARDPRFLRALARFGNPLHARTVSLLPLSPAPHHPARGRTKACAGAGAGEQHQLRGQASIWQAQEEASKEVSDGER